MDDPSRFERSGQETPAVAVTNPQAAARSIDESDLPAAVLLSALPGWRVAQKGGGRKGTQSAARIDKEALSDLVARYADRRLRKWKNGELTEL